MGSNKARDDKFFNCSEQHEIDYVCRHYKDQNGVRKLLEEKCADGTIKYSTSLEVYKLIKNEMGYEIPIEH